MPVVCLPIYRGQTEVEHTTHAKKLKIGEFHYLSLHSSEYYAPKHDGRELPNCDMFADCLVRLPLFYELKEEVLGDIIRSIKDFYNTYTV